MSSDTSPTRRRPLLALLMVVAGIGVGLIGLVVMEGWRGATADSAVGKLTGIGQTWCPKRSTEQGVGLRIRNQLDRVIEIRTDRISCGDWSGAGNPTNFNTSQISPSLGFPKTPPGTLLSFLLNSGRKGLMPVWEMEFLEPDGGKAVGTFTFRLVPSGGNRFDLEVLNRSAWDNGPLQLQGVNGELRVRSLPSEVEAQQFEILLDSN